jgi:hypothetical protein
MAYFVNNIFAAALRRAFRRHRFGGIAARNIRLHAGTPPPLTPLSSMA